jgi:hypothetical protein
MLCTSCALTYDVTPYKCELMLRGEQCLSDHRCCNPPQTYYNTYPNYYNWWWATKPNYTNYVIIKPNNKPNKPNRPNNNKPRPNNKPKHRK